MKYKDFYKPISIILIYQAIIYWLLKLVISDYHILSTSLTIPLIKEFSIIYNLWYPLIILTSFLIYKKDKNNFKRFTLFLAISVLMAELTFIIYPSQIIRPEINGNTFCDFILKLTYKLDNPAVNCFPSVHCLYSFGAIYFLLDTKKIKVPIKLILILAFILIILGTLFIHQHILADVILAFIYFLISIVLIKFLKQKLFKIFNFLF